MWSGFLVWCGVVRYGATYNKVVRAVLYARVYCITCSQCMVTGLCVRDTHCVHPYTCFMKS